MPDGESLTSPTLIVGKKKSLNYNEESKEPTSPYRLLRRISSDSDVDSEEESKEPASKETLL